MPVISLHCGTLLPSTHMLLKFLQPACVRRAHRPYAAAERGAPSACAHAACRILLHTTPPPPPAIFDMPVSCLHTVARCWKGSHAASSALLTLPLRCWQAMRTEQAAMKGMALHSNDTSAAAYL